MILFSTRAAAHIARTIEIPQGRCTITQFSDGELYVHIKEEVKNKEVWLLAATPTPAENILELCFMLDALQRAGARINLFITYFGYARQVTARAGESCSAQVISAIVKNFMIQKIKIMHPHSILLHDYLPFTGTFDIDFFCACARGYDIIAAPDAGAAALAEKVAQACDKDFVVLKKIRPSQEEVHFTEVDGSVARKKVLLVDDIIATGRTLAQAAQFLKEHGAVSVAAAATHGIFSHHAQEFLSQSSLEVITVTNTIAQQAQGKVKMYDVSGFIQRQLLHT